MDIISIIIPIFNMETFVESGIESIEHQTYSEIEIILVDDGSTDKSFEKCKSMAEKYDNIIVYHQDNLGAGPARNKGIELSKGKYIYFHDIDDYLYPEALRVMKQTMDEQKVDLVVGGYNAYDGTKITKIVERKDKFYMTGDEIRNNYYPHLFMDGELGISMPAWFKLFRADIIKENNITFPPLKRNQDQVFVVDYVGYIKSAYFINKPICRYLSNTITTRFRKIKFDYFILAKQSTMAILNIIGKWNKDDKKTRDKILCDYFVQTWNGIWGLFNPALGYSHKQRFKRIKEISKEFVKDIPNDANIPFAVFEYMKKKKYILLYFRAWYFMNKQK